MTNLTETSEQYVLEDGEGLIDLRGEGDECGIIIENRPIAITWPDGLGSVGQYIVRSRNRDGISDRLRAIREVANHGIRTGISLSSQISPLISLFATGVYTLEYWYEFYSHNVVWDKTWSALDGMNVYPACCQSTDEQIDLIPTQAVQNLLSERIAHFEESIKKGCRPVVFIAGVSNLDFAFVLDGHHKLRAYEKLQTLPSVVFIKRQHGQALHLTEGLAFLNRIREDKPPLSKHTWEQEYRRHKQNDP